MSFITSVKFPIRGICSLYSYVKTHNDTDKLVDQTNLNLNDHFPGIFPLKKANKSFRKLFKTFGRGFGIMQISTIYPGCQLFNTLGKPGCKISNKKSVDA
jgi:hypothetical protein